MFISLSINVFFFYYYDRTTTELIAEKCPYFLTQTSDDTITTVSNNKDFVDSNKFKKNSKLFVLQQILIFLLSY
jgi:hypothetical protein